MDFEALRQNIATATRTAPTIRDAIQKVAWLYNDRLPVSLRINERVISFRYPLPVGEVALAVRSNNGADSFILSEVFDRAYYDLPLRRQPRRIMDLGANTGMTAIYFARRFPGAQIICVEPMPTNLALLHRNLALNHISAKVYEAAVDASDGETTMDVGQPDYGFKVAAEGLRVLTVSVPTIMAEAGWDEIDLLKIDIEGHESIILRKHCDWLRKVKAICIEIHDDYTKNDLVELADKYGFSEPKLLPGNWLLERP